MQPPESSTDGSPSPTRRQLQGPRPPQLRVRKDSHVIKKPPIVPPQHAPPRPPAEGPSQNRQPVIIYAVSPKVIHTTATDFMSLVQRLTGSSSSDQASGSGNRGDVSPAARLASIERTSPRPKEREKDREIGNDIMGMFEGIEMGQNPGILSPAPGTLPPISPGFFFSPRSDPHGYSILQDLSSPLFNQGNMFMPSPLFNQEYMFMPSPSTLFNQGILSPAEAELVKEKEPRKEEDFHTAIEMGKKTGLKLDLHETAGKQRVLKTVLGLSPSGFQTPDKQNLSMPDPNSKGEEDSQHLQLQMHQYSDATFSIPDLGSNSGTAPEGGVLYMEKSVRLNEMGEVATQGLKLSPEVSYSSEEELLEQMWLEELEETPSDPGEVEDLNCDPMEVPPTISHHFSILHILDLSYTEINSLPQSISRLVALQKLFLRSCDLLHELPPEIGELSNLQVLDLEGTEILSLPKEIAKLVNLTCLKVSFYGYANKTVIPRRVLSNLSRLNELIIHVTPYGEWWDVEVEAIIDDLCSLDELRTLKLYLPIAELLEGLTRIFSRLAIFRFTVGRHEEHFISRLPRDVEEEFNNQEKLEKGLKYINGSSIPNEIAKVFKHASAFFLQRHWTAKSLSEFGHENMNEVKFCLVMECNEFRTIIDSEQFYQGKDGRSESEDFMDIDENIVLGSLQKMIIRYMKNMASIWNGPVGKGSLSNLKSLALHTCPNLATVFTIDMLSNLINLEDLIVEDCPKIESFVSLKSSNSKSGPFLPKLKKISLLELPELVSISSGLWIAPKLEKMVIFYCPKLGKLSTMDVSITNLKVIKGEKEWWDAVKWYESDMSTKHEDYLARLFIPLRRDGDLMAQLTKD